MTIKKIFTALLLVTFATPVFSWTISADFDSGELGTTADRGGDGFSGAGGNSIYTNERAISGHAAKLTIEEGQTGWGKWGGALDFPSNVERGDKIWYQVHIFFPTNFDHYSYGEGNRLKFMRIQTKSSSNQNQGYLDFIIDKKSDPNAFKWIYEGENRWHDVGQGSDMIVKGQWESYQMAATFDTTPLQDGGLAEIRIWKNGQLLQHITNRKTMVGSTNVATRALLFTYWNGGSPKTQSLFVDEITITNEAPNHYDANGYPMLPSLVANPPARIESLQVE